MSKHFEISKFALLLFLPAVLWLISNNYVNRHYHILGSGKIISHAHPYCNCSQSPIQDHHHTDFEYSILAQIATNSNPEITEAGCDEHVVLFTDNSQNSLYHFSFTTEATKLPRLRAPPVI